MPKPPSHARGEARKGARPLLSRTKAATSADAIRKRLAAVSSGGRPSTTYRIARYVEPHTTYTRPRAVQVFQRAGAMLPTLSGPLQGLTDPRRDGTAAAGHYCARSRWARCSCTSTDHVTSSTGRSPLTVMSRSRSR